MFHRPRLSPLLTVLLLSSLPALAGAQVRDWSVTYDSGGVDRVGCSRCDASTLSFVPVSVRSTHAVAADLEGNSWIAGGVSNGTNDDIQLVKHDADGKRLWAVTYDGGDDDSAAAVAADGTGNVYVAGTSYRMTPEFDVQPHALLLKYGAAGNLLWVRVLRTGVWSQGLALAVTSAGKSYLAVQNYNADDYVYAELLAISPAGAPLGSDTSFFNVEGEEQGPTAVALDAAGNAYMAGWVYKPQAADRTDFFVARFGGWSQRFDSGAQDVAYDLAVDGAGRVFATGQGGTVAFSSTGTRLWSASFSGTPHAVAAADGAVWVTGTGGQDFRTARYDAATGTPGWTVASGGSAADAAYALSALGSLVYVTGTSSNGTDDDILTVGLDAATGAQLGQDRVHQGGAERAAGLAAAGSAFWVAGTAGADALVIRYAPTTAGPAVSALTLTPATFPGGCQGSTGRVTLSTPAPAGGTVVQLASTNPVAVLPRSVTVPAGQTRASFSITAPAVTAVQTGTVSATAGGQSRILTLKVRPIGVASLSLTPNPVTGPAPVDGTVALECAAAPGNVAVQLSTSDSAAARPNAPSLLIPAGAAGGHFTLSTADLDAPRRVNIKAVAAGVSRTVALEVQ